MISDKDAKIKELNAFKRDATAGKTYVKIIAEKDKIIAEKDKIIAERDKTIAEKDKIIERFKLN